jgi:hypothetical protein
LDPTQAVDSLLGQSIRLQPYSEAWAGLLDWRALIPVVVSLVVSVVIAAAIAYHPRTRYRNDAVGRLETPKALLLYAMIGTVVAQVVAVEPAMALVVFGIGGLLRFRTIVGAADDTGLVILVTVTGIACGLNLYPLAIVAAGSAWALMFFLESQQAWTLIVDDLPTESFDDAVAGYVTAVSGPGLTVLQTRQRKDKGRVTLVLKVTSAVTMRDIETRLEDVPQHLRGEIEWEDL